MAIVSMADAVSGGIASSAEYNKLIDNIEDLDGRLGSVVASPNANSRLSTLETRTTDTSGVVGIGNQRLSDRLGAGVTTSATADARFGSGVGTGSNVTTGSASSQLTDLRSRVSTVESTVTNGTTGNAALGGRVTALEAAGSSAIAMAASNSTTSGTTSSSSYTATLSAGTSPGLSFVAPASGKAKIDYGMVAAASSATQIAYATIRVRTGGTVGSGTDVLDASTDNWAISVAGDLVTGTGRTKLVTGLTAGSTYNVQMLYRSSSGAATFVGREVVVTTG
jgi:hypothetical protein